MKFFSIEILVLLSQFTNIIIANLEGEADGEETELEFNPGEEPTANFISSSMAEYNPLQDYDNNQSLDIQARGSKRPWYNNGDDNY